MKISRFTSIIQRSIWMIAMVIFTLLMSEIVIAYSSFEKDVAFLLTKQLIIHLDYYLFSFYIHITSSLILMISGGFLFINFPFQNWWKWHRRFGKIYVGLILVCAAPTGIIMGYHANGGLIGQVNFVLLAIIWWAATYIGYRKIRLGDIAGHKSWMTRSYALTLSAITLRMLQMILPMDWFVDLEARYVIISWGSWVLNLIIVEIFINNKTFNSSRNVLSVLLKDIHKIAT